MPKHEPRKAKYMYFEFKFVFTHSTPVHKCGTAIAAHHCFANSSACAAVKILLSHCVPYSLRLLYTVSFKNGHLNPYSISVTLCHS